MAQAGQREHRGPLDALMVQGGHVILPCPMRESLKLLSALVRKREGVGAVRSWKPGADCTPSSPPRGRASPRTQLVQRKLASRDRLLKRCLSTPESAWARGPGRLMT